MSAAALRQSDVHVASNGTGFLAVWRDGYGGSFAAELSDRGHAPVTPLAITGGDVVGTLASDGDGYLASWVAFRNGALLMEGVTFERRDGGLIVHKFSRNAGNYVRSLTSGGAPGVYLVVWNAGNLFDQTLVAARVRPDGIPIDVVPIPLWSDKYLWTIPSVAFDGEDFIVAASFSMNSAADGPSLLHTFRVSLNGTARFDRTWSTRGVVERATLDCGGRTCLIAWTEQASDSDASWRLVGQRFRMGGELIDANPFDIDVADTSQSRPTVAWDGSRYVVTWTRDPSGLTPERIEARTIVPTGTVHADAFDLLAERDRGLDSSTTACNHRGRCLIVEPRLVDDSTLGRTTRMYKRFFGDARRRGARR